MLTQPPCCAAGTAHPARRAALFSPSPFPLPSLFPNPAGLTASAPGPLTQRGAAGSTRPSPVGLAADAGPRIAHAPRARHLPTGTFPRMPASPPHGWWGRTGQTMPACSWPACGARCPLCRAPEAGSPFGELQGAPGCCHLVSRGSQWGLGCLGWAGGWNRAGRARRPCPEGPPQNPARGEQGRGESFLIRTRRKSGDHKTSLEMTSQNQSPTSTPHDSTVGLLWLQLLCFNPFQAVCFDFSCWGGLHDMPVQDEKPCVSHTHPN